MKNIPNKIYLQVGFDKSFDEDFEVDFNDLSGVTWGSEEVFNTDIEYVRAGIRLDKVRITHPIVASKSSPRYSLILTDSAGVDHYFNHDGTYDGYSSDPNIDGRTGTSLN